MNNLRLYLGVVSARVRKVSTLSQSGVSSSTRDRSWPPWSRVSSSSDSRALFVPACKVEHITHVWLMFYVQTLYIVCLLLLYFLATSKVISGRKHYIRSYQDGRACQGGWVVVGSFMSWSYQEMYRLITVHTHGDFTVLPHWETKLPAP